MLKESIRMSWQNIRGNKMRTFLTMLGIIIGVTAIIADYDGRQRNGRNHESILCLGRR